MSSPAENILEIVTLPLTVIVVGDSVVVPAISALRAAASREVNAEPAIFLCLGVPCVLFRVALVEAWHAFLLHLPISQVLVIPDIVIIVTFYICSIFLTRVSHLPSSWLLEPLLGFLKHAVSKYFFS